MGKRVIRLLVGSSVALFLIVAAQVIAEVGGAKASSTVRAAFLLAGSILAGVAYNKQNKAKKIINGYIRKMNALIAAMERFFSNEGLNVPKETYIPRNEWKEDSRKIMKGVDEILDELGQFDFIVEAMAGEGNQNCIVGTPQNYRMDADCNCRKNNSCAKLKVPSKIKLGKGFKAEQLEDTLKGLPLAAKYVQYAVNGEHDKAIAMSEPLHNLKPGIERNLKILDSIVNAKLKRENKKAWDSFKEAEKVRQRHIDKVNAEVNKLSKKEQVEFENGWSDAVKMPELARSNFDKRGKKASGPVMKGLKNFLKGLGKLGTRKITGALADVAHADDVRPPAEVGSEPIKKGNGARGSESGFEGFELESNDIHKNSDTNLFDIIKTRYNRFFLEN